MAAQILSLHGADHGAVFLSLHTKPQGSSEKKLAVGWGSQTGCAKMILLTAGNIAHIYNQAPFYDVSTEACLDPPRSQWETVSQNNGIRAAGCVLKQLH